MIPPKRVTTAARRPTGRGPLRRGICRACGALSHGRPITIAQLGLLVLVATPVVPVLASVIGFALEGDRLYAAITLGVFAILLISLIWLR